MRSKQREEDIKRKNLKPDIQKSSQAISKTIEDKAFIRDKQREEDHKRMQLKPDIQGIGEKLEEKIEKIEDKKRESSEE
jgi:hypothetical protein